MFGFIIKALVFDLVYSLVIGLVLMIVMLPLLMFSKSEEPGPLSYVIGIPAGMAICAVQGIIIAAAVVMALQLDPNRWSLLWYIVGFGFSIPIAVVKSLNDPNQRTFSALSILAANISYILACIFPKHIPPILGDTAIKFLL